MPTEGGRKRDIAWPGIAPIVHVEVAVKIDAGAIARLTPEQARALMEGIALCMTAGR